MTTRAVSVRDEVMTIAATVRGATALAQHAEGVGEDEARQLQPMIAGVLTLVACRLRDLERVLHGEVDPAAFHAPHNAAPEEWASDDEKNVVLVEWTAEELALRAADLLRAADESRREAGSPLRPE